MWQRFTSQARKAIFDAQEEAQRLGHSYVSTEHILLGLIKDSASVACKILVDLGVSLTDTRIALEQQVFPAEDTRPTADMSLTPRGKRTIDLAYYEARGLSKNYIGSEHLLLGLISERDGIAGRILSSMEVDLDRTRQEAAKYDHQASATAPTAGKVGDRPAVGNQPSWQRFSEQARKAVYHAQEEAERLEHRYLSTEHLLLGIVRDATSAASIILMKLEVSLDEIRSEIARQTVAEGVPSPTAEISLSPRGKRVIDLAYDEARNAGRTYIGTEHLLLGLILQRDGIASKVLTDLGVDIDRARQEAANFDYDPPDGSPTASEPQPRNQPMWQRFTERARKVVFYAQEEAQKFGEGYVSTEHMLLGLVRESDSVSSRVLEALGISLNRIRAEVEKQLPRGDTSPSQDMTLTPRCKRVIDLAYDEARNLNNNYIGTEHLLLGLIREGDGLAGRVLAKLGADLERARREVMAAQEAAGRPVASPPAPPKPSRTYAWSEYDETAQRAILLADEMARSQGEKEIAPHHLVSALLADSNSAAVHVLRQAGLEPDVLLETIERYRTWAAGAPDIQVSPNTRKAIDATYSEASSSDAEKIGAEHLLLGLALGNGNGVGLVLNDLGVSHVKLRRAVLKLEDGDEPNA